MARIRLRFIVALVLFVSLPQPLAAAEPAWTAGSTVVVVPGTPPLTRGMVVRFTSFFEWALESRLPAAERMKMRALVVGAWRTRNRDDMRQVLEILEMDNAVASLSPAERNIARVRIQQELAPALRVQRNPFVEDAIRKSQEAMKRSDDRSRELDREMDKRHDERAADRKADHLRNERVRDEQRAAERRAEDRRAEQRAAERRAAERRR